MINSKKSLTYFKSTKAALLGGMLLVSGCDKSPNTPDDGDDQYPATLVSPTVRFDVVGGIVTGYGFANSSGIERVTCNPNATGRAREVEFLNTDDFITLGERARVHMNDATATFPRERVTTANLWLDNRIVTQITIPISDVSSLREGIVVGQISGDAATAATAVNKFAKGMVPC